MAAIRLLVDEGVRLSLAETLRKRRIDDQAGADDDAGGRVYGPPRRMPLALVVTLILALVLPAGAARSQQQTNPAELLRSAELARKAKNFPRAIELYQQALAAAKASGMPEDEWVARTFLALTHKLAGDTARARELHEENLAFVRANRPKLVVGPMNREIDSLEALAAAHLSAGELAKAASGLEEALALSDKDPPTSYRKGKLQQKLGTVQFLSGETAAAEKTLSSSLATFELAMTTRFGGPPPGPWEYDMQTEVIRWLERVLVAQNRTNEALELAQKGRARALARMLAGSPQAAPPTEGANPMTLSAIREVARTQGTTLVEYSVLYRYDPDLPLEFSGYTLPVTDILVWAIKPTGEITFHDVRLEPPVGLDALVLGALDAIRTAGRETGRPASPPSGADARVELPELRRLHALLIEPIMDSLPSGADERVTFLPQDLLFFVPFAALQDDTGKFLIDRHTLNTAPSIEVLRLIHRRQTQLPDAVASALIVGNPTMPNVDGEPLPSLPGAEEEARNVAALLKAPFLVGDQATKKATTAQMSNARLIHIATHGTLDDVEGAFSALALAPANGDSGFLTAREILAMRLNAELVVLSACDSGKGKISGGGVAGLVQAFVQAGASAVLVSLWPVEDKTTAPLIRTFYQGLIGGADKAGALRLAMLTAKRQNPSSLDWAGFSLIGDPDVTAAGVMKRGMAANPASPPTAASATRYTVFPVPDEVEDYREWPAREGEEVGITFETTLTIAELMSFYRRTLATKQVREVTELTQQEKRSGQLVFRDLANGKKLVVQCTDMQNGGRDRRTVSVRFE